MHEFNNGNALRQGVKTFIEYYNRRRPHQTFEGKTPHSVYENRHNETQAVICLPKWNYISRTNILNKRSQDDCIAILLEDVA